MILNFVVLINHQTNFLSQPHQMEIIEKKTIIKILNRIDLLSEIEHGFISYSQGKCVIPPIGELTFDEPQGDVHIKYGYIKGEPNYVIKIASGYWKNH